MAGRPVSLFRLYRLVMEHGGYDILSAERMRWRQLTKQFGFGNHHEAAMTFQLKTVFYKYLAAYEIATFWGETPPPPEILENLTAKGGDLRTRTIQNFPIPGLREPGALGDGADSGDEEQSTPRADTMDVDEPGSAGRYSTRQLRQDPKKTQLYQPETSSTRQRYMRATSSPQTSPAPAPVQAYHSVSADPRSGSFNLEKYEPRQPMALTLRPVITPSNNPDLFRQRKALAKVQSTPKQTAYEPQQLLKPVLSTSMHGPNIYIRCLYGLRSGIPAEQDFALHHLVKVSYERGDKYKFEGFPLLAESLLEKALEVTSLIYGVRWKISYEGDQSVQCDNVINGSYGTPAILDRLNSLEVKIAADDVETEDFSHKLDKLNEAVLVIRNMVILEENAAFISRFPLLREFLTIAINLPNQPRLAEYQHYALEIAEQVTRYWELLYDDPLYLSLLNQLDSNDRGRMLSAMRAIIRIAMDRPQINRLKDVPVSTVQRLISFLLLDSDDDTVSSSLDLLYQYTAISENMNLLLAECPDLLPALTARLASLLLHAARSFEEKVLVRAAQKLPPNNSIPIIPNELFEQLLEFQEPTRSSHWLRCCFEESPQDDITQIAIWQAYQGRFQNQNPIPAADFIKNVSNTFATAQAQVINGPTPRFIIKGIRPKRILMNLKNEPQFKCLWESHIPRLDDPVASSRFSITVRCGQWQSTPEKLWSHILVDHLNIPRSEDGKSFSIDNTSTYRCHWSGCTRSTALTNSREAAMHVRLHLPETAVPNEASGKSTELLREAEYTRHTFYSTPSDEKGLPVGIAWMAVMVLRNLARFATRQQYQRGTTAGRLMENLFGNIKGELWHNIAVNRTLGWYLQDLMRMVTKGDDIGQDVDAVRNQAVNGHGDLLMT